MPDRRSIAYFSMEIALESSIPTYAGGLGVLAGDTIRAAADLNVPIVAVSLLYRKGYFTQRLDAHGVQREEPTRWAVAQYLEEMPQRASAMVERRTVHLRAWKYIVRGISGFTIPVYFLDADLPDNVSQDRALTDVLYGGDARYRLSQEILLGIGGVHMLRALGYQHLQRFHMNEGHASLLTFALLDEQAERTGRWIVGAEEIARVRQQCVFTTHTPVPAGHDEFSKDLVDAVLGRPEVTAMPELFGANGNVNLTTLGFTLSRYVNGVAKKHGEISRQMFDSERIDAITNGIHAATWAAPAFQVLFDRHIPQWREDNFSLRHAMNIGLPQIAQAHRQAKRQLLEFIQRRSGIALKPDVLTLGFARRVAMYKRADLLFCDLERLQRIAKTIGPIQVVYAGKAHPNDQTSRELIKHVFQAKARLASTIPIVYLDNYDVEIGQLMTAGADVWLNTPLRPLEASGTSGMKAALNGVPSLSMLDGWWVEGHIEGVTGWSIGDTAPSAGSPAEQTPLDAASLYEKLERVVLPLFYQERDRFLAIMRQAIALNGSFFNTQRMVQEYVVRAYFH